MLDESLQDILALVIEEQALSHFTSAAGPIRCAICYESFNHQRPLGSTIGNYGICRNRACLDALTSLYFEAKALIQVIGDAPF